MQVFYEFGYLIIQIIQWKECLFIDYLIIMH